MATREYPTASVYPGDSMTLEYRSSLIKLLADQARAELFAAHTYSSWLRRAPGPEEKMYLAELAKEETEHWYKAVKLLEELGVSPSEARKRQTFSWFYYTSRLLLPRLTWIDILMMSFLIDHGAYFLVEDFAQSSYASWAKMAQEILKDEEDHPDFGANCLRAMMRERGAAPVQRALNKWWRLALNMFGAPVTKNTDLYIRLGLKYRSNEERRQAYRRSCEPKIQALGLTVPTLYRRTYPFF